MCLCLDVADISFRKIGQRFDVDEMILMFLTSLRQYVVGKTEDGGGQNSAISLRSIAMKGYIVIVFLSIGSNNLQTLIKVADPGPCVLVGSVFLEIKADPDLGQLHPDYIFRKDFFRNLYPDFPRI